VGPIAQSVEQLTFNPWVDGSSPSGPTLFTFYLHSTDSVKSSNSCAVVSKSLMLAS